MEIYINLFSRFQITQTITDSKKGINTLRSYPVCDFLMGGKNINYIYWQAEIKPVINSEGLETPILLL